MPVPATDAERIATLLAEATSEAATHLQELAATTPDKETRKEAKRALYRLSLAGITPTERKTAIAPAREPLQETLRAFATAYDGAGNRLLFFVLSDRDGGTPTLARVRINDEEGVSDYEESRLARRAIADYLAQYEQQLENGLAYAEIEPDYARWLLAQAQEINRRLVKRTPAGFLPLAGRIGAPQQEVAVSPVYAHIDAETVRADESLPTDPKELFALSWFEPWFFSMEEIIPTFAKVLTEEARKSEETEANGNDETEKGGLPESIIREASETLLSPERRRNYIRRLEESADILRRRGEEGAARLALYHALKLAEDTPIAESDFAKTLVNRTIEAAREALLERTGKSAPDLPRPLPD